MLSDEGYDALGVNRIAAKAGLGKPLIYRYFGNLDGLVVALALEAAADLAAPVPDQPIDSADPMAVLSGLLDYGRRLAANGQARALLLREVTRADVPGLEAEADRAVAEPAALADRQIEGPIEGPIEGRSDGHQLVGPDRAAIHAVLRAAIVFLVICRDRHPRWDGISMVSPKDMVRLESAVAWIVRQAWPTGQTVQGDEGLGGGEKS